MAPRCPQASAQTVLQQALVPLASTTAHHTTEDLFGSLLPSLGLKRLEARMLAMDQLKVLRLVPSTHGGWKAFHPRRRLQRPAYVPLSQYHRCAMARFLRQPWHVER